jgi:outer membrane protein assembly factor BamA
MGILVMRLAPTAALLIVLAGIAHSRPRLEVPTPGRMGVSRLEDLIAMPADLARQPRDSQNLWMEFADSSVALAARGEGHLEARCRIALAELDSAANKVTVRMEYAEGPEYRFGRIQFVGIDGSMDPPSPDNISVSPGDGFRPSRLADILQDAQQYYRRHGWLDASVEPEQSVRADSALVDLRFSVNLGRVAIFEAMEIRFKGQHITDPAILRGLWSIQPGDTIRNEDLARYNRKLGQTRLFNLAKLTRGPGVLDPARTTVYVDLAERIPGSLEFGLSWEPTFGTSADGTLRYKNVKGSLNELSLAVVMAEHRQSIRPGVGTPLLLGTPISLDYGISLNQQEADLADTTAYRELAISTDGTFSYLPTDWSNVSLSGETRRVTKFLIAGGSKIEYQFKTDLGAGLDFRNDPFDPTRGWSLRSDIGWGGQIGNDTSYVWLQSLGRYYQPLFWRFYSAFALEGGQFLNATTSDGAKIFYLGGSRTVRSYVYRGLMVVPQLADENDSAKGYASLRPRYLRTSAELRMNLPWSFQAVGFVDWARLWNKGQAPDLFDLEKAKLGYGAGLRWRLSLLSLRVDYAFGRGGETWIFDLAQAI